ncbi:hypothetical protein PAN31117_03138 [Pandoraea anapnoica]|uniref:Uncharacterized protein n=1 Tax=Pandoraea anapnoica TaxID=2508301 RepID=A0A5E5A5M1_9BURK|nr:hypothetical protein PAN31117_03138 [Pandoraea anapnoica]
MFAAEIRQFQLGWNDARCGRPCQSTDLAYRIGYGDATH